ncbi:murein hydrolase activator EnvC family protein [Hyphococcus sp.]|uniref:murein hydrolase activator EnvC family protein n=1 Tax=Hyphococcus sp. TaxID=2038636 RepID=UPI003CCB9299
MKRFLAIFLLAFCDPQPGAAQVNADDLKEVEEQLKERAREEKRLREEAEARKKEVAALRHRLIETANSLQEAERKIAGLEDSIAELEAEKTEAEASLRSESQNLSEVLAALQSLELSRPPALLVSPEDANEAARAAMLLSDAAPEVEARAARLRAAVERLSELAAALEKDRASYAATNRELQSRRDVLAELMEQKEEERDVAEALAASAQRETARIAAQASSLREMIERLSRLAHSITPRIKPAPPKSAPAPDAAPRPPSIKRAAPQPFVSAMPFDKARGALRPPVAGRVIGEFGKRRPEGGNFEGMRFAVRDQGIVTAPFEGRVAFAMEWRPVGNMIVLDVGEGYHILLIGVGEILVREHQRITAGEPVAEMAGGGANLDLEIRKNGEPVNPALWLSRKSMEGLAL